MRAVWPASAEGFEVVDVTVGDLLRHAAAVEGPREALIAGHERVSYTQLLARAEARAGALTALAAPGERVALWASNSIEWTVTELAAALAGVVIVPVNPAFRAAEAGYIVAQSGAVALVYEPEVRGNPLAEHAAGFDIPTLQRVLTISQLVASDAARDLPAVSPHDPFLIVYTSGTTGRPKGAVLHHRGIANKCRIAVTLMDLGANPVWLNMMPMSHIGGSGLSTIGPLSVMGTQVLIDRFDPAVVLEVIERERATFVGGVPTMLLALIEHADFGDRDLRSLRSVLSGGAAVAPELVRRIESTLGVKFMVAFGQTEGHGHMCQTRPDDSAADKADTVGRAIPHVAVQIVDPNSGEVVEIGEVGELCVKSPFVMHGYHAMPEATAAAIDREGFLHTGDLCTLDERGYVRFVGRTKEMIVRGGENIYPKEIEDALHEHAAVADVAVVGVPDERYGEIAIAFVRAAGPVTEDELRAFVRGRLAPFKCPAAFVFVDQFPLTGSGKVQKFALRDSYRVH